MAESNGAEARSNERIAGLWDSEADLEESIAADRLLIKRGLKLHNDYCAAMEAQERAREAAAEAARARGEVPSDVPTAEERAWDEYNDRELSGIALRKEGVFEAFGLDPRKSVLFGEFPELLARACDPQCPVLYDPSERQFSLMETWGPAVLVIRFCPWSGRPLPKPLSEEWHEAVIVALGTDDWSYDDARAKLPRDYWTEAWWSARGL